MIVIVLKFILVCQIFLQFLLSHKMDFSTLNLSEQASLGAKMVVLHPITNVPMVQDDGQTEISITLVGSESDQAKKSFRDKARQQITRTSRNKLTVEDAERMSIEVLADCTVTWEGVIEGGQRLECTKDHVIMMYTKYSWLKQQVEEFVNDRTNFYQA